MNYPNMLIIAIAIPCTIFSQTISKTKALTGHTMNVRHAANYYLHNKNPSLEFSPQYTSVFSGLRHYTKRDTVIATKLIKRLYKLNDILFFRLMRIRLQWEFKERYVRSSLDSTLPRLENNTDSAKYHYMLSLYFLNSLYERIARGLGYVKVTYDGSEVVDWRKMKVMKWRDPTVIEAISDGDGLTLPQQYYKPPKAFGLRDALLFNYKLAIEKYFEMAVQEDPAEFHYLRELIVFMYNQPENRDEEIRQLINSKLENYTDKQQRQLKTFLAGLPEFANKKALSKGL